MVDKIDTSSIPSLFAQASQGTSQMLEDELLEEVDMGWEDGQWTLPEELLVDDDVEKAIYQLGIQALDPDKNISGIMTPYGNGLNEEQIAELVAEYPGIVALADAEGGDIKTIVDEAGTFEDMNNQEISDAVEEVLNSATNAGEIENIPFVMNAMGKQIGDAVKAPNVWKPQEGGKAVTNAKDAFAKAVVGDGTTSTLEKIMGTPGAYAVTDTLKTGSRIADRALGVFTDTEVGPQVLNKLFQPDTADGYDATPEAVAAEIRTLLASKEISPENVVDWMKAGGFETLAGAKVEEYRAALNDVMSMGRTGLHPDQQKMGTKTAGAEGDFFKKVEEATDKLMMPGGVREGTKDYDEDLQKYFYQQVYTMPGAGRSDIAWRLPMLFADTKTMWLLYNGSDVLRGSVAIQDAPESDIDGSLTAAKNNIVDNYKNFLQEYFSDPDGHRTGSRFNQNLQKVNRYLQLSELPMEQRPAMTGAEQSDLLWIDTFFNKSLDSRSNRRNLIKMAITRGGQGWYSQQLHKSIEAAMDEQERMGKTGQEIFTLFSGIAQRQGESVQPEADDADAILNGEIPKLPMKQEDEYFGTPTDEMETDARTTASGYSYITRPSGPREEAFEGSSFGPQPGISGLGAGFGLPSDVELQSEGHVNPWQLFKPGQTALTVPSVPLAQQQLDDELLEEVDMGYRLPYGVTEGLVPTHPNLKNQPFSQGEWVNPVPIPMGQIPRL